RQCCCRIAPGNALNCCCFAWLVAPSVVSRHVAGFAEVLAPRAASHAGVADFIFLPQSRILDGGSVGQMVEPCSWRATPHRS
ncbi:hypothetical protein HAX54_033448, partial [Datura stramonium]|nr:hypothetical protein [Datura stramonium]